MKDFNTIKEIEERNLKLEIYKACFLTIGLFLLIIGFILLVYAAYYGDTGDYKTVITDCYDRYSNKIDGLTCDKQIYDYSEDEIVAITFIAIGWVIILASLLVFGALIDYGI